MTGAVNQLQEGGLLLLENVRYHAEEETNDAAFAEQLAANADVYVNDAFWSRSSRAAPPPPA